MRVLDVGAHDGFVGRWLQERFDSPVELYGMELHPQAAQKARDRGYVQVVEDVAENAPDHWGDGFFDAAVAYELVEHVVSPDALLGALERVVRPGGRVFLSTPEGTFGTGSNPHHLRVFRAADLADLVRRRGRLVDMQVGSDGIVSAAYIPGPRLADVAIYTGPGWERWSPMDIEEKGLGGSETAAVRLAEALSEIGWVVTVYGEVDECAYRDVLFRHWSRWDPTEPREAVIASRAPQIFDRPVAATTRLLWLHDVDVGDELTGARAEKIDHVLVLSRWHEEHVAGRYPFAAEKIVRTRNGIVHDYAQLAAGADRQPWVAYTSSPDRGLDVLLELWPRVVDRVPDAEMHHAYSPVYDAVAAQDPIIAAHRDKIRGLSDQPGVVNAGHLTQPEVAQLLARSRVWAHPSWSSPTDSAFCETSCIGAVEAQAAGCLVVASNWGALPETVRAGRLVDGPAGDRWRDAFVDQIVEGLTDRDVQRWAQAEGPKAVAGLDWLGVGKQVAGLIKAPVPVG